MGIAVYMGTQECYLLLLLYHLLLYRNSSSHSTLGKYIVCFEATFHYFAIVSLVFVNSSKCLYMPSL